MAYINNNGQVRIGVRAAIVNSPVQQQQVISASLLQSLYGVWNGDTTTNELGTSLYGVWNAEYSGTASLETSLYGVWNGDVLSSSTLKTSLYAVYNGDNLNDSFGTNNGTAIGSVTYGTGKMGNAFQFNGSSFVKLPENSIRFTNSFSVSFWLKTTANQTTTERGLIADYYWNTYSWGYYISLRHDSNKVRLFWRNGSTFNSLESSVISLNQWNHVCVVWDKANTNWKIYINGVLDNQISTNSNDITYAAGSNRTNIGGMNDNSPESLNGSMDSINFWSKAITQAEVTELYNSGNGTQYVSNDFYKLSPNDSFGTNHGTLMNGCTFTTGKIGNAFSFDGVDDYVSFPNTSMRFTGDFSISCFVYFNAFSTYNVIFENYYGINVSNRYGFALYQQSNKIRFATYNVSTAITVGSTTLATGQWYHIVVTKALSNSPKIYVNGVLETMSNGGLAPQTLNPAYDANFNIPKLGAEYDSNTWSGYLNGKIDAVNTWQKELSANEVSMLYNGSNGTQYQSGSFGLTQSSLDSFGTYHGTLSSTSFGTGKFGSAFNFTGGNINMGTGAANFGTNPFTISLWFYPNAGNNLQMLVAKGFTGGTDKGFYLNTDNRYNSNQNGISFGLSVGGGTYRTIVTTSAFPYTAAAWNHLVVTRSGNTTLIYLNGVLASTTNAQVAGSGDVSGDISNTGANMLLAQYGSGGLNFSGRMDALTMWNRAISVDEVTQLYNSGTGNQYPFVGTFSSAGNQLGMDNGTLMNGCYLSDGKIGKAFTFDGVNDYVSLPNNSLNFTGDFSIGLWVYFNSLNNPNSQWNQQFIFSNSAGSGGNNYGYYLYKHSNNNLMFVISNGTPFSSNAVIVIPQSISQSTWYHLLITRKYGTSTKVYINGVEMTSAYYSTGNSSINPLYLTNQVVNLSGYGNATGDLFNGKIDGFTTWQKELTQSEITELYNSGNGKQITATPIVKSGLVLNLDASRKSSYVGTGTTWNDISGNGYSGTLTNGPSFTQLSSNTDIAGSIVFDGVNDFASYGIITALNLTNITISSWTKVKGVGSEGTYTPILSRYHDTNTYNGWEIYMGSDKKWNFGGRESGAAYLSLKTDTIYSYNVWYNVTCVKSGSNWSIYINGVLEKTLSLGLGNVSFASNTLNVGAGRTPWWNDYGFCDISSVLIYNRPLSATEILQNYNSTKSKFGY